MAAALVAADPTKHASTAQASPEAGELPEIADVAARAREGDPAAFRRLVELTSDRLFRVAAHVCGDRDDADDVVQETFIRAWGRLGELRDPAAVVGWLGRIARNAARDRLRARRRRGEDRRAAASSRSAREPAEPGSGPDEKLASAQLAGQVRRAVDALSDKHRVVLLLREVDGMSYQEIAELLAIPAGTVESRLHRARARLARALARLAPEVTL
jgi:RNA polymerase sigma-70 factor (ECF subfamily)